MNVLIGTFRNHPGRRWLAEAEQDEGNVCRRNFGNCGSNDCFDQRANSKRITLSRQSAEVGFMGRCPYLERFCAGLKLDKNDGWAEPPLLPDG